MAVKYKFGIYNRCNEEFEMGGPEKVRFKISNIKSQLQFDIHR